jgi:hypothetical protein
MIELKNNEMASKGGYPLLIYPAKKDTGRVFNEACGILMKNCDSIRVFCGAHHNDNIYGENFAIANQTIKELGML